MYSINDPVVLQSFTSGNWCIPGIVDKISIIRKLFWMGWIRVEYVYKSINGEGMHRKRWFKHEHIKLLADADYIA